MQIDPRNIELIDPQMATLWRTKSVDDGLRSLDGLYRFARDLLTSGVRAQHPDWDAASVQQEVNRRMARGSE